MVDLGTDLSSEWTLTEHGDLRLISQEDNLAQAITNRLTCTLDNLGLYYNSYGSLLNGFLGWKRNNRTLEFMKIEMGNRLKEDPRVSDCDIDLEYNSDGDVDMNLTIRTGDASLRFALVLDTSTGELSLSEDV